MPAVGSSAYQTAGTALTVARAALNDLNGLLFSDTVLLAYLNTAYRQVQRAIAMTGAPLFVVDDVIMTLPPVVTPDPSIQCQLSDNGYSNGTTTVNPPQLPVDMIAPSKIFERQTGTNFDFQEMTDLTSGGGLPSLPQTTTLAVWEWRTDGIWFLGSIQKNDIRLRYQKAFIDLTTGTDPIYIRQGADCIGLNAAAMAALARGSPLSEKWATAGENAIEALVAAYTRRAQNRVYRRRPNSSRTGGYWGGWSTFQSRQ